MVNLDKVEAALEHLSRGQDWAYKYLREAADELLLWRENVEYMLEHTPEAIRVREGGGEEDMIMSLVVTIEKLRKKNVSTN